MALFDGKHVKALSRIFVLALNVSEILNTSH